MKKSGEKFLSILLICMVAAALMTGCGGKKEEEKPEEETFNEQQFMEDIAPVIDVLHECDEELFGADVDFSTLYSAGYSETDVYDENNPYAADGIELSVLYPEGEGLPAGYIQDPAYAIYYPVSNFVSKDDVREYLKNYMTDDVINGFDIDANFIEYEGALYLQRGGRGYGSLKCVKKSAEYVGEKDGMQQVRIKYEIFEEHSHYEILSFEETDEGWKLAGKEEEEE